MYASLSMTVSVAPSSVFDWPAAQNILDIRDVVARTDFQPPLVVGMCWICNWLPHISRPGRPPLIKTTDTAIILLLQQRIKTLATGKYTMHVQP